MAAEIKAISHERNIINLKLYGYMKAFRKDQAETRERIDEVIRRLASIETGMVRLTRDTGHYYSEMVEDRHELDRLKQRIDRIEARLELTT